MNHYCIATGRCRTPRATSSDTAARALFFVSIALAVAVSVVLGSLAAADGRAVILLNGNDLTLEDIARIAENRADVGIAPEGMERIKAAQQVIQHFVDKKIPAYGVNTMYGQDVDVVLSQDQIERWNRVNVFQEATTIGDGARDKLPPDLRPSQAKPE